ncbi:MAG: hypothetical protein PVF43_05670 [Candidatus Eiseniibacteriota bacterium]|jgi:hypothetical protein
MPDPTLPARLAGADNLAPLIIFALLWLVEKLIKARRKSTAGDSGAETATTSRARYRGVLARYAQSTEAIAAQARATLVAAAAIDPAIAERLATVLDHSMTRHLAAVRQRSDSLEAGGDQVGEAELAQATHAIYAELTRLGELLEITGQMVAQRRDPETCQVLGDADALAEACYRPILDFCRHHGIEAHSNVPMTLLHPGGTALHVSFLADQLAPITLPHAVRHEPWRWPAIAHEIAHDLMVTVPGFLDELAGHLGLDPATLERRAPGTGSDRPGGDAPDGASSAADSAHRDEIDDEAWSTESGLDPAIERTLFLAWMEEIAADVIGVLMIGPAYLRAMTALFARPDALLEVLAIPVAADGTLDPHPPRHLRVHLTAHVLRRMGYGSRGAELRRQWDTLHGEPEAFAVVTSELQQLLPAAALIERANDLGDRLYNAEMQVMAGHRLADVPGLEFGTGHLRRAETAARSLARGVPAAFDARSLIAAATEAALDDPSQCGKVQAALRTSIVGVGTRERIGTVRARATAAWAVTPVAAPATARPGTAAGTTAPAAARPAVTAAGSRAARRPGARRRRRQPDGAGSVAGRLPLSRAALIDALLLEEILVRPRARR